MQLNLFPTNIEAGMDEIELKYKGDTFYVWYKSERRSADYDTFDYYAVEISRVELRAPNGEWLECEPSYADLSEMEERIAEQLERGDE